jgi:galactokinase/mevalonate kinase-like predicted kinase
MHGLAERLSGDQRKKMLGQREQVLQDIQESIEHMQSAVRHYQELMNKETRADLSTLRDELDASIRIAKKTEERIRELEGKIDYDDPIKQ